MSRLIVWDFNEGEFADFKGKTGNDTMKQVIGELTECIFCGRTSDRGSYYVPVSEEEKAVINSGEDGITRVVYFGICPLCIRHSINRGRLTKAVVVGYKEETGKW